MGRKQPRRRTLKHRKPPVRFQDFTPDEQDRIRRILAHLRIRVAHARRKAAKEVRR